jgi:hypothetical protein
LNITELTDEWLDRLIQRYRDELDAIDRVDAGEYAALKSERAYLRSQIRGLVGEKKGGRTQRSRLSEA